MSREGPTLCKTSDGRAVAKFAGRVFSFGRANDPESRDRFDKFKGMWLVNGRKITEEMLADRRRARPATPKGAKTVAQIRDAYIGDLRKRKSERWLKHNLARVENSLKPLVEIHGTQRPSALDTESLHDVREQMSRTGRLCRQEVNSRFAIIRKALRWAASRELAPTSLALKADTIDPLERGDYGLREGNGSRGSVSREVVDATLPYLGKTVAAAIEVMWWTGARPAEVLGLRPEDIDRSGKVWTADLQHHKTEKKGRGRTLHFGPEAQKALLPLLVRRPADHYIFSPQTAVEEWKDARRHRRTTKLYDRRCRPRKAEAPKVKPGEHYNSHAISTAIKRAVARANTDRDEKGLERIPRWTPYQLRHAAKNRIERAYGLEHARAVLGHASPSMTERYGERDRKDAARVMGEAG